MNKKYIIKNDTWVSTREIVTAYKVVEDVTKGTIHTLICNACNKFVSKKYFWYLTKCCNHCGNKHVFQE